MNPVAKILGYEDKSKNDESYVGIKCPHCSRFMNIHKGSPYKGKFYAECRNDKCLHYLQEGERYKQQLE